MAIVNSVNVLYKWTFAEIMKTYNVVFHAK
jgi:hypothetical protein